MGLVTQTPSVGLPEICRDQASFVVLNHELASTSASSSLKATI